MIDREHGFQGSAKYVRFSCGLEDKKFQVNGIAGFGGLNWFS